MFEESSKANLIARIEAYREINKLESIESLSFVLESYWCGLPENAGNCVPVEVKRGVLGYLKGGVALVKQMMYKSFARQEVADARSVQCSTCEFNVFPDKTGFIAWSDKIAEASVGERRSIKHDELGNCAVCSCPLRAKVFYNGVVDIQPEWAEKFNKVNCWQRDLRKV